MSTTITVRVDDSLRRNLETRARTSGTTLSETVRTLLEESLMPKPLGERIGELRGSLDLGSESENDPWRRRLRERNWRS